MRPYLRHEALRFPGVDPSPIVGRNPRLAEGPHMLRGHATASILVLVLPAVDARSQCLDYEPRTVRLTGVMKTVMYPGLPNYESVRSGDKPEAGWYLFLDQPICVNEIGN
jgi:hypothetical protein